MSSCRLLLGMLAVKSTIVYTKYICIYLYFWDEFRTLETRTSITKHWWKCNFSKRPDLEALQQFTGIISSFWLASTGSIGTEPAKVCMSSHHHPHRRGLLLRCHGDATGHAKHKRWSSCIGNRIKPGDFWSHNGGYENKSLRWRVIIKVKLSALLLYRNSFQKMRNTSLQNDSLMENIKTKNRK